MKLAASSCDLKVLQQLLFYLDLFEDIISVCPKCIPVITYPYNQILFLKESPPLLHIDHNVTTNAGSLSSLFNSGNSTCRFRSAKALILAYFPPNLIHL